MDVDRCRMGAGGGRQAYRTLLFGVQRSEARVEAVPVKCSHFVRPRDMVLRAVVVPLFRALVPWPLALMHGMFAAPSRRRGDSANARVSRTRRHTAIGDAGARSK